MIMAVEKTHPLLMGRNIYGVADPAIWDESRGESIAQTMERHGLYFDKGDHTRIAGKMQVHYRLAFDGNGKPMMQVFETCKDTIRTMPELLEDEHNPEDVDTDCEDHIFDEMKYHLMEYPVPPRRPEKPKAPAYNPLDFDPSERVASGYGFIRM